MTCETHLRLNSFLGGSTFILWRIQRSDLSLATEFLLFKQRIIELKLILDRFLLKAENLFLYTEVFVENYIIMKNKAAMSFPGL